MNKIRYFPDQQIRSIPYICRCAFYHWQSSSHIATQQQQHSRRIEHWKMCTLDTFDSKWTITENPLTNPGPFRYFLRAIATTN